MGSRKNKIKINLAAARVTSHKKEKKSMFEYLGEGMGFKMTSNVTPVADDNWELFAAQVTFTLKVVLGRE